MAKVQGVIRDVSLNNFGEPNMLLMGVVGDLGQVFRDHVNVRQRDLDDNCNIDPRIRADAVVEISCEIDDYFDKGKWKKGLINVKSIKVIPKRSAPPPPKPKSKP